MNADYHAAVFNHAEILINVKVADGISKEISDIVIQRFKKHHRLPIHDAGCTINIRFEENVPVHNSKWGVFQAHRQVMGLVYIAHATNAINVAFLHENFHKMKEEFGALHARCLIFGIDTDLLKQHSPDVLKFSSLGSWKSYDHDVKEFLSSIYYELDAKRLKLELEKGIKPPMIKAPFETISNTNMDGSDNSERKNYRKRCIGRHLKHLGDISLLAGKISNALLSYHSAIDTLTQINDVEWIGSALEGLCAISAIVRFSHPDPKQRLTFNSKQNSKQVLDPRNLMSKQSSTISTLEDLKKLCIPTLENIVDRYKEAVIHYSRNKSLGTIEMEACIKATRVLITTGKKLAASEFLQNAVYITLNLSDEERVKRYSILANLYSDIGFHRKSSFFKRVAAMQCVAQHLKKQSWEQCNTLLMQSLRGYKVTLKEENLIKDNNKLCVHTGWPSIQMRVFHELIFSSKKMGRNVLANRHTLQFLLNMYPQLSETEERDICTSLESNSSKLSNVNSTNYHNGIYSENVKYSIPIIKSLEILPLSSANHPTLVSDIGNSIPSDQDVFLYTPTRYNISSKTNKNNFKWTVNTACTITLELFNPLRSHVLHVTNIRLVHFGRTKGYECIPLDLNIKPNTIRKANIKLLPTSPGKLIITGYKFCCFGISFLCEFENITDISTKNIEIDVVPELPLLNLDISQDGFDQNLNTLTVNICPGEFYHGSVVVVNSSHTQVSVVDLSSKLLQPSDITDENAMQWKNVNDDHFKAQCILLHFSFNSTKLPNVKEGESCEFEISLQYTGQEAVSKKWCRYLHFNIKIIFINFLNITHVAFVNHKFDTAVCTVQLNVKNNFPKPLYKCFKSLKGKKYVEEEILLKTASTFDIVLDRFQLWKKEINLNHDTKMEDNLLCYIQDLIKPGWKLMGSDGVERSADIDLTQSKVIKACVQDVLFCPVKADLNDPKVSKLENCKICQPLNLNFCLKNISYVPVTFDVKICLLQEQHNGQMAICMRNVVLFNGTLTKKVKNLLPNESISYKCSMSFLYQGDYKLRLLYSVYLPTYLKSSTLTENDYIVQKSDIYNVTILP